MSDRKNRDIGRKRTRTNKYWCDCWRCLPDEEKLRIKQQRQDRKELRTQLGYSRIGLDNV